MASSRNRRPCHSASRVVVTTANAIVWCLLWYGIAHRLEEYSSGVTAFRQICCVEHSTSWSSTLKREHEERRKSYYRVAERCRYAAATSASSSLSGSLTLSQPIRLPQSSDTFILPIFPLRKRVRFPTDELTLNLYEDRYLQMSEFILQNHHCHYDSSTIASSSKYGLNGTLVIVGAPFFGALYVSNKPQLVSHGGKAPIVPMLQQGDIGVICIVHTWREDMIPTVASSAVAVANSNETLNSNDEELVRRRRIRLEAQAVGRFRIDTILFDGTPDKNDDEERRPPFIVVNATMVMDDNSFRHCDNVVEKRMQRLYDKMKQLPRTTPVSDWFSFLLKSWKWVIGQEESFSTPLSDNSTEGNTDMAKIPSSASDILDRICSWVRLDSNDYDGDGHDELKEQQQQRDELLSFIACSKALEGVDAPVSSDMVYMLYMLQTQSLATRLEILSYHDKTLLTE